MGKSNWAEAASLDWRLGGASPTRPTSRTVHLYTASPSDAGGGTEVSTGSWTNYAAQTATFGAATGTSPTQASNSADVDFGTATTTGNITVTAFAIKDNNGNFLDWAEFAVPVIVQNGNPVKFVAGTLVITED